MENKKWKTVKICAHTFEAQMIRSILESEEIPVRMLNENMNNIFPDAGIVDIKIQVLEETMEKANIIVKEFSENKDV
jgi:acetone carboxylase gamma subunit